MAAKTYTVTVVRPGLPAETYYRVEKVHHTATTDNLIIECQDGTQVYYRANGWVEYIRSPEPEQSEQPDKPSERQLAVLRADGHVDRYENCRPVVSGKYLLQIYKGVQQQPSQTYQPDEWLSFDYTKAAD